MSTKLDCSSSFQDIGRHIQRGSIVVFPTDTVFGLGTSPFSEIGIWKCFELKKREMEKKMPVLFSSIGEAEKLVKFDLRAKSLAQRFWPGQLTMILPVRNLQLPKVLIGDDMTLAARVPNHDCCLRLISSVGNCLIGTSANISGTGSFTDPNDPELEEFAMGADYFINGKCGEAKKPSTIVDLSSSDTISIVREGAVQTKLIADHLNISSTDLSFNAVTS